MGRVVFLTLALLSLAAIAAEAQVQPGVYVTEGGWGVLKVVRAKNGATTFDIEAMGGNAHSCSLDGEIRDGRAVLEALDKEYSKANGLPASVRLTTVQPSGTLSLLPGVTPGIHPAYAPYYIRRVRFGAADALVDACRKRGYKVQWDIGIDGREDHTRYVVEFPCESPTGSVLASEMTAIQQLEWVKKMQTEWADNAVSVTVYYRKEELPAIKEWLAANYDSSVKSVSFLLHTDHNFPLPPYEEITKEQYEKIAAKIDFSIPLQVATGGLLELDDCSTGACPVR